MLKNAATQNPNLQAPGMGLPKIELYIARFLVGAKLKLTSQEKATEIFASEAHKIIDLVGSFQTELASKQVLIDRLRGLEDSSRYWSLYMTLEHLRIVNSFTIDVIQSLLAGVKPKTIVSTAAVKPQVCVSSEVVQKFQSVCEEFKSIFPPNKDLQSNVTLAHPWFGELNAKQWHFFAGFHMALHRKQMLKIIEKL